jgi:hypothetical protein
MTITARLLPGLLLAALALAGCGRPNPSSSPEALVEAAYEAIRAGSWEEYSGLTVTTADFILEEHNAQSRFKAQQSYVGSVLKPEEQQRQRQDFARAVAGGVGLIDFRQRKFGQAHLGGAGDQETLSGSMIPVSAYLVSGEGEAAPTAEGPAFVVVKWGSFYRLLGLRFPDHSEDEG